MEIRSTLALLLEFGGHGCSTAANFEEAASLLREGAFDLVLAGYGEDTASNVSARYLELVSLKTPVIFLSEMAARFEMIDNGTFVGPPIPLDLLVFVQSVLKKRLERRKGPWPQREYNLGAPLVSKKLRISQTPRIAT